MADNDDMSSSPKRRYEPDRRSRIIAKALDVIAQHGLAGTTHRRIAAAADVPLGSMTYHFSGVEEVISEAFKHLSTQISDLYIEALERAKDKAEAREVVVQLIVGDLWASERNMGLQFELYAYAVRQSAVRDLVREWTERSQHALEQHFDSATAKALDAFLEGVTTHNFFKPGCISESEVREMIRRLTS